MPYVKRTIEIHFDSEKLVFDGGKSRLDSERANEQHEAFLRALGYMVFYGMTNSSIDSVAKGGIAVGADMTDVEICLTYRDERTPEGGKPSFTMAAIAREDGTKYTTHS